MKKQTNIEKVAQLMGLHSDKLSDSSATYIDISNENYTINICFDGKGKKFTNIVVAKSIYEKIGETVIADIKPQ